MRIAHIINNLAKGGAEKLLTDALLHLKNRQVKVMVILLSSKGSANEYIETFKKNGIQIFSLSEGSVYNLLLVFKLRATINKIKPDILHVHLFPAMYWAALSIKIGAVIPLIFTEHSTQNKRFNNTLLKPIDKFIYKTYNRLIAISPAISDKLQKWTHMSDRIEIIRNGVETTRFINAYSYSRDFFINELGIPESATLLMMTARFAYPKDHKTLVDTLHYLPDNFYILFVGDGLESKTVKKYVEEKGFKDRVVFFGFRADVPNLMKSVDINILSSFYEGMSGVTCEALAAGKPFLGSDVPGINDVVPDKRFLFASSDVKELAAKIEQIVSDTVLRNDMVKTGIEHIKQFDMENMANKTIALYHQLISHNRNH